MIIEIELDRPAASFTDLQIDILVNEMIEPIKKKGLKIHEIQVKK